MHLPAFCSSHCFHYGVQAAIHSIYESAEAVYYDVDLLETNEYSVLFIYVFSYSMFPVIMPQMKHESSLAPAMVATFADFPFLSSFAIFCFILFEPLSA